MSYIDPTHPRFQEHVIEAIRLKVHNHVNVRELGWALRENTQVSAWVDNLNQRLVTELVAHIAHKREEKQGGQVTVRYPTGWWEFFKLQYAPKWWLRRWPVKWTEHVIVTQMIYETRLCPHLPMAIDGGLKTHVRFLVHDNARPAAPDGVQRLRDPRASYQGPGVHDPHGPPNPARLSR